MPEGQTQPLPGPSGPGQPQCYKERPQRAAENRDEAIQVPQFANQTHSVGQIQLHAAGAIPGIHPQTQAADGGAFDCEHID